MNPPHVMLLASGESVHSQRFLQMLLDSGYRVSLVDPVNPKPMGVEHYQFIQYPSKFGLERFRMRGISKLTFWLQAIQLRWIWQRIKPDIVHVHWVDERAAHCALTGMHPLVLTCWGSDINGLFDSASTERRRKLIARTIRRAARVTADSPQILERCEILAGHSLRSSLFYFGIDLQKFRRGYEQDTENLRKRLGIAPTAKVFLSIRRPVPWLGHSEILRAFANAVADAKEKPFLLFHRYLTEDPTYERELRELGQEFSLSEHIIWIEGLPNDEMPILYNTADVVINFPSQDGFPVSLFEACACKRLVISSDLPAYADFFNRGEFIRVPVGDVAQLAAAMRSVLMHPGEYWQHSIERNYEAVVEVGDQTTCIQPIHRIYTSLTKT